MTQESIARDTQDSPRAELAVIGGSGLYGMDGLTEVEMIGVDTPFGAPSDEIALGTFSGQRIAFLARHGRGHTIMPTEVNARANIYALKSLGVRRILSISACGSLKEEYAPGHIVIPDQIYDNTKRRSYTFFGEGLVAHVSVADPFCPVLNALAADAVTESGGTVHKGGTFVIIEGPRFSTKAESGVYRHLGFDIIGMTAVSEAQLAREAEICYSTFAHITDYDVWNEEAETASVETVLHQLAANTDLINASLRRIVPLVAASQDRCACDTALATALITDKSLVPPETLEKLGLLVGKYF